MNVTEAVILAAGEGSRMRPLTYARPKVMLPIINIPILEHLMLAMANAGIKKFVLVTGYHEEEIRSYFGSGEKWNAEIKYVTQKKQLGTADAVRTAGELLHGNFLVANGDIIISSNDIMQLTGRTDNTLTVFMAKEVAGLGVIEINDDKITRIHEKTAKPPTNLINAGLYLFTLEILDAINKTEKSSRGEYEITESIQKSIDSGNLFGYYEINNWFDLSYPWDLLRANEIEIQKVSPVNAGTIEDNVTIKGTISLGENSIIRSGAYIDGPVIIGRDCDIGPNCYLRAGSTIGDGCHIGAGVEIKNSIIMNGTKIPHLSYVGDSIIGQNCNLGAGTKIANLRFDKKEIFAGKINTRRRKFGTVMGDGVQTGINAMVDTGCLIGDNCFIGPGATARGVISPGTRVY